MSRLLFALLAGSLLVTGCVDERSFYIRSNVNPCVGGGSLGSGLLDLQGRQGYVFYPEVVSELSSTKVDDGEPERNRLVLEGFEVEVDLGQLGSKLALQDVLVKQNVPVFGTVDPGATIQTSVVIITQDLVEQLRNIPVDRQPWVIIKIRAIASHNGSTLKSSELEFPVQLCRGCLMSGVAPGDSLPDCPTFRPAQANSNSCGLPQDEEVYCCNEASPRCLTADELNALPTAAD